jgi:hypothetical protein
MPQQKGLIVERILRNRDDVWRDVIDERGLGRLTVRMLLTSALCLAAYGAVLGASHSWMQALSSVVKLPLLFLVTLLICLPTLYLFNLIFGARLTLMQAVVLIMVCITVISVLALAFAPISLFFLITAGNYAFLKLLNVAVLTLSALVGLRFLTAGMARLTEYQELAPMREAAATAAPTSPAVGIAASNVAESVSTIAVLPRATAVAPPPRAAGRPASMTILYIWMLLFGFVGTQLAWTLRPFFGSPDEPFELFRDIDGTFYSNIFSTIGSLFG